MPRTWTSRTAVLASKGEGTGNSGAGRPWAPLQRVIPVRRRVRQFRETLVEEADLEQPVDEVPASEPPGCPRRVPAREHDAAPGEGEFLCELAPALTRAHDHDVAVREFPGVAVVGGVEDRESPRDVRDPRGPCLLLEGSGGDDHHALSLIHISE